MLIREVSITSWRNNSTILIIGDVRWWASLRFVDLLTPDSTADGPY